MNLDDYNKVIKSSNINPKDYYYHAFNNYEINAYLSKGILSPILLKVNNQGNNGPYYVSLSKLPDNNPNIGRSIESIFYYFYNYNNPMFLIDNSIFVFNCSINSSAIFIDTPLPLRPTSYIDEVQRFLRVSPKYIKGIEIPLYNILNSIDEETSISKLNSLKTIISNINELPIYDYSDLNNIKEINKEDCLKLL